MIKSVHGGDIYSQKILYDFSANINPLGMPESAKAALIDNISMLERYPDINFTRLKKAIAEFEHIGESNIVCGNGAADLIYKLANAANAKKALVLAPTFSEYERALKSFGCKVEHYFLNPEKDFVLDKGILSAIDDIDLMFLCNPNNPVGNICEPELMNSIISKCKANNVRIVVDECFMSFVEESEKYRLRADCNNIIILKAFTKIYAMAGLRLGYLICRDEKFCCKIESIGQCWSVSAAAQITGEAALSENDYLSRTVSYVKKERDYLTEKLANFGFKVYPSMVNFILFKTDLPLDRLLLKEAIAIRDNKGFVNLESGHFRIAVRTHEENEVLVHAIERIIKNG